MNYKRGLPGRPLVKFILSLALVWGILALAYLFIPSFNPKDTTITDLLEYEGKTITRVYESEKFFKRPRCHSRDPWTGFPDEECQKIKLPRALDRFLNAWTSHIIFEMKLVEKNGAKYLNLAGGTDPLTKLPFDLGYTPLTGIKIPLNFHGLSHNDSAIISEPFSIRVGNTGWTPAGLTPMWLSVADTALLKWWLQGHDSVEVPLRVLRDPLKGRLEVWPEHWGWDHFPSNHTTPVGTRPLISVAIPFNDNRAYFSEALPEYPISASPTPYTFPARLILLLFLIPIGYLWYGLILIIGAPFFFGVGVFSVIIILFVIVLAIFAVIALIYAIVWWVRNGRPPFTELGRRSGVSLRGHWGQPAPGEGETATSSYGFLVSLNRAPVGSQPVSLGGPERDLEAGTGTPATETEEQLLSTSKGKQPASQED